MKSLVFVVGVVLCGFLVAEPYSWNRSYSHSWSSRYGTYNYSSSSSYRPYAPTYVAPNGFRSYDGYYNGRLMYRGIGGPCGRLTFIYRYRGW